MHSRQVQSTRGQDLQEACTSAATSAPAVRLEWEGHSKASQGPAGSRGPRGSRPNAEEGEGSWEASGEETG